MSNVSVNAHVRAATEMYIGRPLTAHAWITIGDVTLFMGNGHEEVLYNIDRLTDLLSELRQHRVDQEESIKVTSELWKKGDAARM